MTCLKIAFALLVLASCTNQSYEVEGLNSDNHLTQHRLSENRLRRRNFAPKINLDRVERNLQTTTTIRFDVYNSVTDTKILELVNGTVIDLSQYGLSDPTILNIEAIATGPIKAVSTQFALDVTLYNRVEGGDRRSLCGNTGGDFGLCKQLKLGAHNLAASVYSQRFAAGQLLGSTLVSFEIIKSGKTQTQSPIKPPTPVTSSPVVTPVKPPAPVTSSPVVAPVAPPSPSASTACPVPKFISPWENWAAYPVPIAESMGGMIGDDFIVVSGYSKNWNTTTKKVYAYNVKNASSVWRAMDDVPTQQGFSHAAFAVNGLIMYVCGGYVGATPGPQTDVCLQYNHTVPPGTGTQWKYLPPLPEGRGGGGLGYIKSQNKLIFATGAIRPNEIATDYQTAWEFNLSNLTAGWVRVQDIPYKGNHVSHVSVDYKNKQRFFIAGGQWQQNEKSGNQADNVEWDYDNKVWIRRANMTYARGHASSSTVPYGCGYIMAGGAMNTGNHTSDISYYNIETDSWTKIGDLVYEINTPACDIVRLGTDDWFYCQTGGISTKFNWRRKLSL